VPFAAALSEHPVAAHATGEVVGRVLESLAEPPDLAILLVSGAHVRHVTQVADAVRSMLAPRALIGATTLGVLAGGREVEDHPAIALWAGAAGALGAHRLQSPTVDEGWRIAVPEVEDAASLIVLAAPGFPVDEAVADLGDRHPGLTVVGGVAGAGLRPGDTQLIADGAVSSVGAVGVLLDGSCPLRVLVSPGCRPIGSPLVVTRAEGSTIHELAGRPVLDRLEETLVALDRDEQAIVADGLHLGRVIDEHRDEFGPGDFHIGAVTGFDRVARSITLAEPVAVGTTVQFQVRDAFSADQDLRATLAGHQAAGALVFAGSGRGSRLFGDADHDAELVSTIIDRGAAAGLFASGVFGPPDARAIDDSRTAVVALFDPR
jgi:small ligand-binding sensory domain FIST